MLPKDDTYYKINLKHFLLLLAAGLTVIIIINFIFYEIDKSYEKSIKMFYLQGQMQVIENIVVTDIASIAAGKEIEDLLVVKNISISNYSGINSLIIKIPK